MAAVWVRVLQTNRTNRRCLLVCLFKELAYTIMEAKKSFQWASQGPRRADGRSASPKPSRLKTQEEPMFAFKFKAGKDWSLSSMVRQEEQTLTWERGNLFILFRTLTDWVRPTHIREQSASLSPVMQMGIPPRKALLDSPRIMFDQIPGHPWDSQSDIKLSITAVLQANTHTRNQWNV